MSVKKDRKKRKSVYNESEEHNQESPNQRKKIKHEELNNKTANGSVISDIEDNESATESQNEEMEVDNTLTENINNDTHDDNSEEDQVSEDESNNENELNGNGSDEESSDEESSDENTFCGKTFHESLSLPNAIERLPDLINAPDGSVSRYLEAGGNVHEIISLLNIDNKKDFSVAVPVFQTIHLVVIEIMSSFPDRLAVTEKSCQYLIDNFMVTAEAMLSSTHKNRIIVLKLLTAIVTLSANIGKQILGNLSLHSEIADTLTNSNSKDKSQVRTCFIHFLMSFLVDGNTPLILSILNKRYVLSSIFSGLMHDSASTIVLVLQTIKMYVVENINVPKTIKLHTFNTRNLLQLLKLYDWKGPRIYKTDILNRTTTFLTKFADSQERDMVQETVHEVLLIVCTSYRHGVIFNDATLGTTATNSNQLMNSVIHSLKCPWEQDRFAELVIKIIVSCPDLFNSLINRLSPKLALRISENWQQGIDFLIKLFKNIGPNILMPHIKNLSFQQLLTITQKYCLPHVVLKEINEGVIHQELAIKHKVFELLNVMLQQYIMYNQAIESSNIFNLSELQRFKSSLDKYIMIHLPSVQYLLTAFNSFLEPVFEKSESAEVTKKLVIPSRMEHLELLLDFFSKYKDCCPTLFESLISKLDTNKLVLEIDQHCEDNNFDRVHLKSLQLLFALDSSVFSPDKNLYQKQLPLLFTFLKSEQKEIQFEAKKLLYNFFQVTGIFDSNTEIDLWLYSYYLTDSTKHSEVAEFLIKSLLDTYNNSYKYVKIVSEFQENSNNTEFSVLSKRNFNDIFENLNNTYDGSTNCELNILGPMLPCALDVFETQYSNSTCVEKYLSTLLVFLLHNQSDPNILLSMLKNNNLKIFDKYFVSWSNDLEPAVLKKPFGSKSVFSVLSKVLLTDETPDILSILGFNLKDAETLDSEIIYHINGKEVTIETNLEPIELLCLINLNLFYLSQLGIRNKLNQTKVNNIKEICICLLDFFQQSLTDNTDVDLLKSKQLLYREALQSIFTNPILLAKFTPLPKKKQISEKLKTDFIICIVDHLINVNKAKNLIDPYLELYRFKFISKLHLVIQKQIKDDGIMKSDNIIEIIKVLELNFGDCEKLLNSMLKLDYKKFVSDENEISIWCQILTFILTRISELKTLGTTYSLPNDLIKTISDLYVDIITKLDVEINLDIFEESLTLYIHSFPHHLEIIGEKMFAEIFNCKRTTKITAKLAASILERDRRQLAVFDKIVMENNNLTKKELIFPLLNAALKHNYFNQKLFDMIFKEYETNIMKIIEKPQKIGQIYKDNNLCVTTLIKHCMDFKICKNFTDKLQKYDVAEIYHLKIIHALYMKVAENSNNDGKCFVNYFITILQLLNASLKRGHVDFETIDILNQYLFKWIQFLELKNISIKSNEILKNAAWSTFSNSALKLGMTTSDGDDINVKGHTNEILLRILAELCELFDINNELKEASTIFQKMTCHSQFFDIMLGPNSGTKTNLLKLMFILANKDKSIMHTAHVPTLLGAYHASLSQSDIYILGLLHLYEKSGISLYEYRPFLWGESAVHHYSAGSFNQNKITHQPTMLQILDLLDIKMIQNTIRYFPIWRSINASEQVKVEDLDDRLFKDFHFDINSKINNEKYIDTAVDLSRIDLLRKLNIITTENIDEKILLNIVSKQLKKDESSNVNLSTVSLDKLYDPAFLLPLLALLLAPEARVALAKANISGVTALAWGALGSIHADTRGLACHVLERLRGHIDAQIIMKDKLIWLQFIDAARRGISFMQRNKNSEDFPQVTAVSSVFLSRLSLIITQPLHPLYSVLANSLVAKADFNFKNVPEWLKLFHSDDVNFKVHRIYILELLRDGVKSYIDFQLLQNRFVYKFIMDFYNSHLSDLDSKILILNVISNTVKMPNACNTLITGHGLIPWLHRVIGRIQMNDSDDIVNGCVTILSNIRYSLNYYGIMRAKTGKAGNINLTTISVNMEHQFAICLLLKLLLKKLPSKIHMKTFERYLLTVKYVIGNCNMFTQSDVEYLINYSNSYVHKLCDCANYLKYGCNFIESREDFVNKLLSSESDCHVLTVSVYLRDFVVAWKNNETNCSLK